MKKHLGLIFTSAAVVIAIGLISFIIARAGAWALLIIPLLIVVGAISFYIIRDPFLGFLSIIFFLPFERIPTYNVSGVDVKINTILGFVTLFAWFGALMFNSKKWKIFSNTTAFPVGLMIIAMLLSLTGAGNLTRGIEVLLFTLFTIALSFMTVNMISSKDDLKKTIVVLFVSSIFVGLFGLFQFAGDTIGLPGSITLLAKGYGSAVFGFPRIEAFSMEPLFFANYLLLPISLALVYFFGREKILLKNKKMDRWLIIGTIALLLINFVLTLSRGAYLGLIAEIFIFVFYYFRKVFTLRNLSIFIVFIVVASGVVYGLNKNNPKALQVFAGHALINDLGSSDSTVSRLTAANQALEVFVNHPVLGIGVGNWGPYVQNYPALTPKTGWSTVNNEYLEIMAEQGTVGIIAFSLLLFILIIRSFIAMKKTKDPYLRATLFGISAAFIGVLVQYNFYSTLFMIYFWVLIGLLVAVQNLILDKKLNDGNQ